MKFIDLFSGIGGFRLALEKFNHKCVFSADNDKYACDTYFKNFKEYPLIDIKKIKKNSIRNSKNSIKRLFLIPRNMLKDNERQRRVYDIKSKSPTLLARSDTPKVLIKNSIRKLTPLECERLQGLPDNYTKDFSNTTRYKMIGNGFTVQVIKYILSNIGKTKLKQEQLSLFH